MKRVSGGLLVAIALSMVCEHGLAAQIPTADRFLESYSANPASANPAGDEAELKQFGEVYQSLIAGPSAEVARALPAVLRYARPGHKKQVRACALAFLLAITARPDGAVLLSAHSGEISSLIDDEDAAIQASVVAVAVGLIMQPATKKEPYLAALAGAVRNPRTRQDVVAERMIAPLMTYGRSDANAVESVVAFLRRDDLTASTRADLVRELSGIPGLPEEANQYLLGRLDDPAPSVRAAAVIGFADSTTAFHSLARNRVEKMAGDSREDPGLRELAQKALAGQSFPWSPDAYVTPATAPH